LTQSQGHHRRRSGAHVTSRWLGLSGDGVGVGVAPAVVVGAAVAIVVVVTLCGMS